MNDIEFETAVARNEAQNAYNLKRIKDLEVYLTIEREKFAHEHALYMAAMEREARAEKLLVESYAVRARLQDEVQQLRERLAELHELGIMK